MQKAHNTDLRSQEAPKEGNDILLKAGEMVTRTEAGEPKLREALHTPRTCYKSGSLVSPCKGCR